MKIPYPTRIFRFLHVDNLEVCLRRGGLHAPSFTPDDGLVYRTIHNVDIQQQRRVARIPCGPRGVVHDYVAFYFGYLSPMLLQLKTGRVEGYGEGQEPLIYLVSTAQAIAQSGTQFVFSDGHGIAAFTNWYDDLAELSQVDWDIVCQKYWADTVDDMDRQRRKQAEFLVHQECRWDLITEIAVLNRTMKDRVAKILGRFPTQMQRNVVVKPNWYY
ncbi:MAG: hypothetical protein KatS3mg111_2646 [Pirellulaceae bacterium]|nr:MAG: hypothetical protein KatS3mg111_2646 [Pirellulaceae bacterium]